MTLFYCYSESCQRQFECSCNNACCQGYTIHPTVWDDQYLTLQEQESLILYHECPECGGRVET